MFSRLIEPNNVKDYIQDSRGQHLFQTLSQILLLKTVFIMRRPSGRFIVYVNLVFVKQVSDTFEVVNLI